MHQSRESSGLALTGTAISNPALPSIFCWTERKMTFTQDQPAPHERSIFRKHLGRALLNKAADRYLSVWDLDFMTAKMRAAKEHLRNIQKQVAIEPKVMRTIRQKSFLSSLLKFPSRPSGWAMKVLSGR